MRQFFLLLVLICGSWSFGQKDVFTFGVQYKPMIPSDILGTGGSSLSGDYTTFNAQINPAFGNVFGGVLRYGFTNWFSIESGINFTQRNYKINYNIPDSNLMNLENSLRIISYEIPVNALFFIRLTEKLYMNAAVGVSMALFPSNVETFKAYNEYGFALVQEGRRSSTVQGALNVNLGFEWRTKKSGYFYLGSSFHMPFVPIMDVFVGYEDDVQILDGLLGEIYGSYLTIDIRYFFHEDPEKKKQRKAEAAKASNTEI